MIEPKAIKAGIAELEKLTAQVAETKRRVPKLLAEADASMTECDPEDRKAIAEIVQTRTTAEVLEKRLPLIEQKMNDIARGLLAEIEVQRQEYLRRLEAERSSQIVAIVTAIRRWAPVFVNPLNGERRDTAEFAARALPIMGYYEDRWPRRQIGCAENASEDRKATETIAAAKEVLELHAAWLANGKNFAPSALPGEITA